VVHAVFAPYGKVEHVHMFGDSDHVLAHVVFETKHEAAGAFGDLHGRNIYDGCCELNIQWGASQDHSNANIDKSCYDHVSSYSSIVKVHIPVTNLANAAVSATNDVPSIINIMPSLVLAEGPSVNHVKATSDDINSDKLCVKVAASGAQAVAADVARVPATPATSLATPTSPPKSVTDECKSNNDVAMPRLSAAVLHDITKLIKPLPVVVRVVSSTPPPAPLGIQLVFDLMPSRCKASVLWILSAIPWPPFVPMYLVGDAIVVAVVTVISSMPMLLQCYHSGVACVLTDANSSLSTFQLERNVVWKPPWQYHNTSSESLVLIEFVNFSTGVHDTLDMVSTISEQCYVILHLLITSETCMSWTLSLAQELKTDDVSLVASDEHSYGLIVPSYTSCSFHEGLSEMLCQLVIFSVVVLSEREEDKHLHCTQQMYLVLEISILRVGFLASIMKEKSGTDLVDMVVQLLLFFDHNLNKIFVTLASGAERSFCAMFSAAYIELYLVAQQQGALFHIADGGFASLFCIYLWKVLWPSFTISGTITAVWCCDLFKKLPWQHPNQEGVHQQQCDAPCQLEIVYYGNDVVYNQDPFVSHDVIKNKFTTFPWNPGASKVLHRLGGKPKLKKGGMLGT
jgi:hypothetical protein